MDRTGQEQAGRRGRASRNDGAGRRTGEMRRLTTIGTGQLAQCVCIGVGFSNIGFQSKVQKANRHEDRDGREERKQL